MATGTIERIADYENKFKISANTDMDNLTSPGVYFSQDAATTSSLDHCPISSGGFAMIIMSTASGALSCIQILFNGSNIYTRRRTSTAWMSWYSITGTQMS